MKTIKTKKVIYVIVMLSVVLFSMAAYAGENGEGYMSRTFSNEELTQMLAPIALYPDSLLSQILMAAAYPFEVVEADRWMTKNPYLKSAVLDEALQAKDWDVSILALCHYPGVLAMMSENLSWTARVGDAFVNQEEDVMDTIQDLRTRARAAGYLSSTSEQRVIVEDRYIRIDPANPDYIYLPAYDPLIVYGPWWLPLFPPLPIILPGLVATGQGVVFSRPFYVEVGVFGWSSFNWGRRNVIIVDINRTGKFNRHVHQQRWPDRYSWRPDADRRFIREKRAGDIPRFVPPPKLKPDMRHQEGRPGPEVKFPERKRTSPERERVIERDTKPQRNQPGIEKGKAPDAGGPLTIDKDKPAVRDRRLMERDKPVERPQAPDKEKIKPPEQNVNRQPVIRDRGKEENPEQRRQAPGTDQKTNQGDHKARERDVRETLHKESHTDKDARQEQPERGGQPREHGDKKP